jgi:hypothetical protein
MELVKFGVCSIPWVHNFGFNNGIGPKKISVVPVSYREKIRVGRSEIKIFFEFFFMVLAVFCWAIFSSSQPPGENRFALSIALKK